MIVNADFTKRYEKIPVDIFQDSTAAAAMVAQSIAELIKTKTQKGLPCVIGISASSSSIPLYEELARLCGKKKIPFSNVHLFSVDEYWPLTKNELQSHYRFLKEYLIDFIDIPSNNIHFLNSEIPKESIHDYCNDFEKSIVSLGGLDALVIGGMGFNEPGSPYNS